MLALALLPTAGVRSAFAADPVAVYTDADDARLSGNPSCNEVEGWGYSNGQDWSEHKLEGADLANGSYDFGSHTITISGFNANDGFSWTSNFGIDAVIIKTGNGNGGYNTLAVYAPTAGDTEATSGTLSQSSPTGISHISFCWDSANPTPTPTTPPTATPTTPPTATPTTPPTATPTTPPTATPTPEASVGGETATPDPTPEASVGGVTATPNITLPPTDTIGGTAAPGSNAWQIMLVVMAGLLASVLVLTPSRTARRR
jgi:hypothetical protein